MYLKIFCRTVQKIHARIQIGKTGKLILLINWNFWNYLQEVWHQLSSLYHKAMINVNGHDCPLYFKLISEQHNLLSQHWSLTCQWWNIVLYANTRLLLNHTMYKVTVMFNVHPVFTFLFHSSLGAEGQILLFI